MNIQAKISSNAKTICKRLNKEGFQAFVVGGAIRDITIGKNPKDFDIVSDATPDEIRKAFSHCTVLEMGAAFGIMTVVLNGEQFEIAQMRIDGDYSDGRRPDLITPIRDIEKDLARRDVTMNAIAWDPVKETMQDPFAGTMDILDKKIRFVGEAGERIDEDRLRILRAFRFMSQLDFELDDDALDAIKLWMLMCPSFEGVSQERITAEFSKIMTGKNVFKTIKLMAEIGLLWLIVPELEDLTQEHNNPYHTEFMRDLRGISNTSILVHVLYVIKFAMQHLENRKCETEEQRLIIMLGAIFHDIGKPAARITKSDGKDRFLKHDVMGAEMTAIIMTRMRFPNKIIEGVVTLVRKHMNAHDIPKMTKVYKIRRFLASDFFNELCILSFADTRGCAANNGIPNDADANKFHEAICRLITKYGKVLPAPLVTGDTLIHLGFKPGPDFKERLEKTFDYQLNGEDNKVNLINFAKGLTLSEK